MLGAGICKDLLRSPGERVQLHMNQENPLQQPQGPSTLASGNDLQSTSPGGRIP
jgi:hypothetical protein